MAAGDAPSTLTELRTDFLEKLKEVTGVSAVNTIVNRFLNQANQDFHQERWWWAERRAVIITDNPYTTGTIALTLATSLTAVTGTDTLWNTANNFGRNNAIVGHKMILAGSNDTYLINAVGSDTAITLDSSYTGTSDLSGDDYTVFNDEYTLQSDFDDVIDVRFFDQDRKIELIGPQEFYRKFPRNRAKSFPQAATLIEIGPSGSADLRRRIIFGPAPDKVYTVPYRFYTTDLAISSGGTAQVNMSADTDQPIIPIRFRQAIVWKALELWFSTRQKNAILATENRGRYDVVVLRARQAHGPADDRPRIVPDTAATWSRTRYPWTGKSRRFVPASKFDHLLDR